MAHDPVLIRLKGGAADYNLDLGFIPKLVKVTVMSTDNPDTYRWFGEMMEDSAEAAAGSWEYGIKNTAGGAETYMATAATGISAYDGSKVPQVLVESPVPGKGLVKADVKDWAKSTSATGRSTTKVGTIVRPTTHNGYVYECTTTGTTNDTEGEPTWPTVPGDSVTETDGVVWTCREENVVANKGKGITLGGTLLESDKIVYVEAYREIRCEDIGDIG
ncbi:MAG: hypothetical protein HWN69_07020 [Desulfobacterales bacterium]|nr:hypothetical protein [Desulfobacterales bacterium]